MGGVYVPALRDRAALEAAVGRPGKTFGGEDLYPDLATKAEALAIWFRQRTEPVSE